MGACFWPFEGDAYWIYEPHVVISNRIPFWIMCMLVGERDEQCESQARVWRERCAELEGASLCVSPDRAVE